MLTHVIWISSIFIVMFIYIPFSDNSQSKRAEIACLVIMITGFIIRSFVELCMLTP